jgi:hypothetical protein
MDPAWDAVDNYLNYAFTAYFVLELLIKLLALGHKRYLKDRMNIFDALVVVASLVELAVDLAPGVAGNHSAMIISPLAGNAIVWDTLPVARSQGIALWHSIISKRHLSFLYVIYVHRHFLTPEHCVQAFTLCQSHVNTITTVWAVFCTSFAKPGIA